MIDLDLLEELLSQDEGEALEFKECLDLASKEGKAGFLKEMLALVNSARDYAYLILGVEDKTKRVVGIRGVTEEQLQQLVAGYCYLPFHFSFKILDYKGKPVGVVRIPHSNSRPHTLKQKIGYLDSRDSKQTELHERHVFVRRGSTVSEATPDEIVEMAQDRHGLQELGADLVYQMEGVVSRLDEIASTLDERNRRDKFPDRLLEGAVVGAVLGVLTGWLAGSVWSYAPIGAVALGPVVAFMLSGMRFVQFGFWRALFTGVFVGVVLSVVFLITNGWVLSSPLFVGPELTMKLVYGALAGTSSGVIGMYSMGFVKGLLFRP